MKLESKFSFGDKVYQIWFNTETIKTECDYCDGKGYFLHKEERVYCNKCQGQGFTTKFGKDKWILSTRNPLTIGEIRITVTNNHDDTYSQQVQYMAEETGIRSGSLYYEHSLFATKEEAIQEVDKRNQENLAYSDFKEEEIKPISKLLIDIETCDAHDFSSPWLTTNNNNYLTIKYTKELQEYCEKAAKLDYDLSIIDKIYEEPTTNYTTVINKTESSKVGDVAVTYAPLQTCDNSCPFKNKGCYAQLGHCAFTMNRLTEASKKATLRSIALEEAQKIVKLPGEKPLRLHISGDCKTPDAAKLLAQAADSYISKNDSPVWTYTHSWRLIPRSNWGKISVLASCETFKDVEYARSRGYAVAMVRYKPFEKGFYLTQNGVKNLMIPCTEQVKGTKCSECGLCWNDETLREKNSIICFFPHGTKSKEIEETLRNL